MSRAIRASRWLAAALAVPLAVAVSSTSLATETPRLPKTLINLSSHSAEFLEDLLTGRVWVYQRNGAPAVMYFGAGRAFHNCSLRRDKTGYRYSGPGWEWRIGTRRNKTALQVTVHPGGRKHGMVVIYTPESGRFHAEQYFRKTGDWRIVHDGWVQDTLPAVMETYCHNLRGLPGLETDRSRTDLDWPAFRSAANPIRNHPGHEYGYIGATGLAASGGKPTMTPEQVVAVERRMQGVIGVTPRGRRAVGVRTPDRKEIWLIDAHDDPIDVGIVNPVPGRDIGVIRWKGGTPDYSVRTRYPVPIRPTPRLHPAFRMMEELAASARPVPLEHPAASRVAFVVSSGGKAASGDIAGDWWISEGEIVLRIAGKTESYPWRAFADAAGWTPPHPPAPPPPDIEIGGD